MQPLTYVPHAIGGGIFTALVWMGKYLGSFMTKRIAETESKLTKIHDVVTVQAENHLCTIQANTGETNRVLNEIRLQMAEQNGYLKAMSAEK
jgi:hypothetical protein